MVGRPREFDTEQVLEAAMQAFWAKGYDATSLNDLVAATGLMRGSLYQAFGDKHSLFVQALNRYLAEMRRKETEVLEQAATPLEGIRDVLHMLVDIADDDAECPKGCMAINSLIEIVPHDPAIERIMEDHMQYVRTSMENAVNLAKAAGEIGEQRSAEVITALMMIFMAGLATQMRGPLSKAEAHELVDIQLTGLL